MARLTSSREYPFHDKRSPRRGPNRYERSVDPSGYRANTHFPWMSVAQGVLQRPLPRGRLMTGLTSEANARGELLT
jgi:hypothetical protein